MTLSTLLHAGQVLVSQCCWQATLLAGRLDSFARKKKDVSRGEPKSLKKASHRWTLVFVKAVASLLIVTMASAMKRLVAMVILLIRVVQQAARLHV